MSSVRFEKIKTIKEVVKFMGKSWRLAFQENSGHQERLVVHERKGEYMESRGEVYVKDTETGIFLLSAEVYSSDLLTNPETALFRGLYSLKQKVRSARQMQEMSSDQPQLPLNDPSLYPYKTRRIDSCVLPGGFNLTYIPYVDNRDMLLPVKVDFKKRMYTDVAGRQRPIRKQNDLDYLAQLTPSGEFLDFSGQHISPQTAIRQALDILSRSVMIPLDQIEEPF